MTMSVLDPQILARQKQPVGLLAGWGRFPFCFAEKARSLGIPVVCVGIRDEASPELANIVQQFHWTGLTKLGRMIRCFKKAGVRDIVMAGKVHKVRMNMSFRALRLLPDWRFLRFWFDPNRKTNADDAILLGIIGEFAKDGMMFASALDLCPELLAKPGILTRRAPTAQEQSDIEFGWEMAKEMGRLDVGQSVCVKEKAVLAVEAIEGTDLSIRRAGELCKRGNFVVVKVAKPQQDMRFDVPTVGVSTVETMKQAGAKVLAIEGQRTIIIDQDETIKLADRYGITIVALNLT